VILSINILKYPVIIAFPAAFDNFTMELGLPRTTFTNIDCVRGKTADPVMATRQVKLVKSGAGFIHSSLLREL
jgi:hypothetical protein